MSDQRFFYHSFPRRKSDDAIKHGVAILESILDRGLLLTPEMFEISEQLIGGSRSTPAKIFQKRVCFTELSPAELPLHAAKFGEFALEFDIAALRAMGAVPVFYFPTNVTNGFEGAATAVLSRLGETQIVLDRLLQIEQIVAKTPNKSEILDITRDGVPVGTTNCSVEAASGLLSMLRTDTQSFEVLLNAIRVFFGFFYPVDHVTYTGELAYYRQREWRIIANLIHEGKALTEPPTDDDVAALLALDYEFFGREIDFPTGRKRLVQQCQFYREFRGEKIAKSIRRLVVPARVAQDIQGLVDRRGIKIEVAALSAAGDVV